MLDGPLARWRRHGPIGLVRAGALRARMIAEHRALPAQERLFDARRGISTGGTVQWQRGSGTTNYQAVHPHAMRTMLRHLPRDRSALTLVDFGSGRGRAAFLAIENGFGAAVGVELEERHHEIALQNQRAYRRAGRERIEFVRGDARSFELPDGPVVLFLYNPFGREVVEPVLRNAVAALRAEPRPAWLVYEQPAHRDLVDDDPVYELIAERTTRRGASPRRPRYAIWRLRIGGGAGA
jgi:SAM-dependent methyltransferase